MRESGGGYLNYQIGIIRFISLACFYYSLYFCDISVYLNFNFMRKIFSKLSTVTRKGACVALASSGLLVSQLAFAQASIAEGIGNATASSISSTGILIGRIFEGFLLIAALVTLVLTIINFMKGEREAASKFAYWFIGLLLGFALGAILINKFGTI